MPSLDFNPYLPRPIDRPTEVPLDPRADLSGLDEAKIFAAPDDPEDWPGWRAALHRWRNEARKRMGYEDRRYDRLERSARIMCMAWLWDELLYDHEGGRFTVDKYLAAADAQFGGFDGVMLWNAYPVLGIDERNHFAFFEDVPELPDVVGAFQRHGVKVYLTYYPWETGAGAEAIDTVTRLVTRLGVDGVFLDSSKEGSTALRLALDDLDAGLTIEGESKVPLARIGDQVMSWGQWFADSRIPGVLRSKWFERRHELHHLRRWHRDHLDELHSAWLNGTGVLVWEVVFGVWVGWNERDRETLRAMRRIYATHADWFVSEDWTPLADQSPEAPAVYASRWAHDGKTLWTVVNRGADHDGAWLVTTASADSCWVDLISGQKLGTVPLPGGRIAIGGKLASGAIAAVAAGPEDATRRDASAGGRHASHFPGRIAVRRTARRIEHREAPAGMMPVTWPGGELTVIYRLRETGLYGEAPFIDEWKPLPPRLHQTTSITRPVEPMRFAIGRTEVTNAQYFAFMQETGYRPARPERFLMHWGSDGRPLPGTESSPAVHVELTDARVYAEWAGFRLPTEDEWQIAAEAGLIGRLTPLVWNLTESEHCDGRSRFHIIKGGCTPLPQVSDWYVESGPMPPQRSVKLLQLGAGLNRSRLIGFRCAADLV